MRKLVDLMFANHLKPRITREHVTETSFPSKMLLLVWTKWDWNLETFCPISWRTIANQLNFTPNIWQQVFGYARIFFSWKCYCHAHAARKRASGLQSREAWRKKLPSRVTASSFTAALGYCISFRSTSRATSSADNPHVGELVSCTLRNLFLN